MSVDLDYIDAEVDVCIRECPAYDMDDQVEFTQAIPSHLVCFGEEAMMRRISRKIVHGLHCRFTEFADVVQLLAATKSFVTNPPVCEILLVCGWNREVTEDQDHCIVSNKAGVTIQDVLDSVGSLKLAHDSATAPAAAKDFTLFLHLAKEAPSGKEKAKEMLAEGTMTEGTETEVA